MEKIGGEHGLSIEVTSLKSVGSPNQSPFPSPKNFPKSPITPVNSPQKILARGFLMFFTLLYALEVVFWFTNTEFNFPHYFDFYSSSISNIQIPQVLAPMSAQAVFTHWMLHIEKIYVNSDPRDPCPIPPEPQVGWNPFSKLRWVRAFVCLQGPYAPSSVILFLALFNTNTNLRSSLTLPPPPPLSGKTKFQPYSLRHTLCSTTACSF
jgi:hypothetical protein